MSVGGGFGKALLVVTRPVRRYTGFAGITIQPYRGYGAPDRAFLMGRAFRQPSFTVREGERGLTRNLKLLLCRVFRFGVAGATVTGTIEGVEATATTDADGYFRLTWRGLDLADVDARPWRGVALVLTDRKGRLAGRSEGAVFLAAPTSDYVVISDIDDTVMHTGVANKAMMMWRLFFRRARSRVAFPGVTAFYRALFHGPGGGATNAMIYVSRAPWSIYEVLEEFFNIHNIPGGPILFLREWGLTLQRPLPRRARQHKHDLIGHIMDFYGDRRFVLIGDSGQRDPEVYADFVARHPERIAAIYIRDVSAKKPKRRDAIQALAGRLHQGGPDLVLAGDTQDMADHAAAIGLIAPTKVHGDG